MRVLAAARRSPPQPAAARRSPQPAAARRSARHDRHGSTLFFSANGGVFYLTRRKQRGLTESRVARFKYDATKPGRKYRRFWLSSTKPGK